MIPLQRIELARKGDTQAFNFLVQQWHPRIYNFAWKYFSRYHDEGMIHDLAMEASQKTFISAFEKLDKLKDPAKFASWLYRIALNHCHGEERKRKQWGLDQIHLSGQEGQQVKEQHPDRGPSPQDQLLAGDLGHWLKKALNQLPDDQRIAIIMKEYEGFTFREIAETLQQSENTIKSRVYYGLSSMRKFLTQCNINQAHFLYE